MVYAIDNTNWSVVSPYLYKVPITDTFDENLEFVLDDKVSLIQDDTLLDRIRNGENPLSIRNGSWMLTSDALYLISHQSSIETKLRPAYALTEALTRSVPLGGGGYVTAIYLHPLERDLMYIRTDVGGFYRWGKNRSRWIGLLETYADYNNEALFGGEGFAIDPTNTNIVYAACGKYSTAAGQLLKSTDQGRTWSKLPLTVGMGGNEERRWGGERLVINPLASNQILFGSRRDGIWRSTDAGATWAKTNFAGTPTLGIGITSICFHSTNPSIVFAASYNDGIYQSIDAGVNWTKLVGSPVTALRLKHRNSLLFATGEANPFVARYDGTNWTNITPPNSSAHFCAISFHPTNQTELIVSTRERDASSNLWRSLDNGSTWTEIQRNRTSMVPWWPDFFKSNPATACVEYDPHVSNCVWLTDWYGVWRCDDITASVTQWTNVVKGHEELVTFALSSPPNDNDIVLLVGCADVDGFTIRDVKQYPNVSFNQYQDTNDIAYCPANPKRVVRVCTNRSVAGYAYAVSDDGGATWTYTTTAVQANRVVISATNPNLWLFGMSAAGPRRTEDGGSTWTNPTGLPNGLNGTFVWQQPLAADLVNGDVFYYYRQSVFYRSVDGGKTFTASAANFLPWESTMYSVRACPDGAGEVWVALNKQGLYRSVNGGVAFTKLATVSRAWLFCFGKSKTIGQPSTLYLYGDLTDGRSGVFYSTDKGDTWNRMGDPVRKIGNAPNCICASKAEFGTVYVGTNGRGLYRLKVAS